MCIYVYKLSLLSLWLQQHKLCPCTKFTCITVRLLFDKPNPLHLCIICYITKNFSLEPGRELKLREVCGFAKISKIIP